MDDFQSGEVVHVFEHFIGIVHEYESRACPKAKGPAASAVFERSSASDSNRHKSSVNPSSAYLIRLCIYISAHYLDTNKTLTAFNPGTVPRWNRV